MNKEDVPAVLAILPLRGSVFFPGGVLPLAVGRQKTIALIKDAVRADQVIGSSPSAAPRRRTQGPTTCTRCARWVKLLEMGEDNYSLVVQGLARFRVLELVQGVPYLKARVEAVEDKTAAENGDSADGASWKCADRSSGGTPSQGTAQCRIEQHSAESAGPMRSSANTKFNECTPGRAGAVGLDIDPVSRDAYFDWIELGRLTFAPLFARNSTNS
jgi:hypothetical protein